MSDNKAAKQAVLNSRRSKIQVAVNNSLIQLRKMGIHADVRVKDDDPDTAFIIIPIEDVRKLIERRCKKAIQKGAGGVEIVAYREDDLLVVRVRK